MPFNKISLVVILFFSLIPAQSSDIDIYLEKGYEYFERDNFEKAILFFSKAYDLEKDINEINSMLGMSYLFNGNLDKAKIFFLNAVEIDSTINNDYYNLACIFALQSNHESSIKFLQKALYWGFIDYKHLINDSDLDSIRKNKKYKDLIKKYFSDGKKGRNDLLIEAEESIENGNYNAGINKTYEFIELEKKSSKPRPILILNAYKIIQDYIEYINWEDDATKWESYKGLYENLIKYYLLLNLKLDPDMYFILGMYSRISQPLNSYTNNNDYGLKELMQASKIYNEQSNYMKEAEVNFFIGDLFLSSLYINNPKNSIPYFEKSLIYYRTKSDTAKIIESITNIAKAYKEINDIENALNYYGELSKFSKLIKDETNYLISLEELFDLYSILGVKEKILEISEKIINYSNEDTLFRHISSFRLSSIWFIRSSIYKTEPRLNNAEIYKEFPIIKRRFEISINEDYERVFTRMIDYYNIPSTISIMEENNKLDSTIVHSLLNDYYQKYYPNNIFQNIGFDDLFENFNTNENSVMLKEIRTLSPKVFSGFQKNLEKEWRKVTGFDLNPSPCKNLRKYIFELNMPDMHELHSTDLDDYLNSILKKTSNDLNECNNKLTVIEFYLALSDIYLSIENSEKANVYLTLLLELFDEVKMNTPQEYKSVFFEKHLNAYKEIVKLYFSEELYLKGLNIYETMRLREFNKQLLLNDQDENLTTISENIFSMEKYLKDKTLIYYTINFDPYWDSKFSFKAFSFIADSFGVKTITGWVNDYRDKKDISIIDGMTTIRFAVKEFDNSVEIENIEHLVKIYLYHLKENTDLLENYSQLLYEVLLSPFDHLIDNNKDLIIIPNHILSFLPFESLSDTNGIYLSQKTNVKYIQSIKILSHLKEQDTINKNSKILAIGGALYNEDEEYKVEKLNQSKTLINRGDLYSELNKKSNLENYYKKIFGNEFPNLPGSYNEVLSIKDIFDNTDLLSGEHANEKYLKTLSTTGDLYNYDIIHFATHATVINEFPELSAIVLTQTNNETEDGFLNLSEVAKLNINADYVNLSACETGLGNVSISGGVDGLAQSFFIAGANSITVSLWAINDEATSIFMNSFYKKINIGDPISRSLNMTKLEFISGDYGEEYKKPYYWAPFVYYGK